MSEKTMKSLVDIAVEKFINIAIIQNLIAEFNARAVGIELELIVKDKKIKKEMYKSEV